MVCGDGRGVAACGCVNVLWCGVVRGLVLRLVMEMEINLLEAAAMTGHVRGSYR